VELPLLLLGIVGILVGLFGVVVPVLPGLLFVWLGTAGTILLHRADTVGWLVTGLLTVLFLLGTAVTIWLPARTGRQGGASPRSFVYAGIGGAVGFFVIPVLGFLVGALLGLLIGEQQRLGEWAPARASTGRVLRAYGIGVVIELVLALTMAATWVVTIVVRG
jgi:uncharacterized protein